MNIRTVIVYYFSVFCLFVCLLLLLLFFCIPLTSFFKGSANGPMMTFAGLSIHKALSYLKQIVILIPVKGSTPSPFGLPKMI